MKLWEKIFITSSIIIILVIIGIYAKRAIYYYNLEHVKVPTFISTLKSKSVSNGDGLYMLNENMYYYKGKEVDNYFNYNGILYRIIGINSNSIELITNNALTTLAWGSNEEYDTSYISEYLKSYNDSSTILDLEQYKKAGGNSSYLNDGTNYWITNENKKSYISYLGSIESDENISSYGLKVVIDIDGSTTEFSGVGTKDNPYSFNKTDSEVYLGEYIKINDYIFRINKLTEDKYYLILNSTIEKEFSTMDKLNNYLNKDFYNQIKNNNLVKCDYNNGNYGSLTNYDYKNVLTSTINNYVGLSSVGDLFINDYSDYLLNTSYDNGVSLYYKVNSDNTLIASTVSSVSNIRPMICINKVSFSGSGSVTDPYVMGD